MSWEIRQGDCLDLMAKMEPDSIDCIVTSPPYWGLRDYGDPKAWGLEPTLDEYLERMRLLGESLMRIIKPSGTFWLNMGDAYASAWPCSRRNVIGEGSLPNGKRENRRSRLDNNLKDKDLIGLPWRVAFLLQAQGWYLRSDIIWAKPNTMPGSYEDRCTSSKEYVFMLTKSAKYWSDFDAIKTPPRESSLVRTAQDVQSQAGSHGAVGKTNGPMKAVGMKKDKQRGHSRVHAGFNDRWDSMSKAEQQSMPVNMRDVWFVSPAKSEDAHFAVMPEEVAKRCILAGCPEGGTVLDPFVGSGTTVVVALGCGRSGIGLELNPAYILLAQRRLGLFAEVEK